MLSGNSSGIRWKRFEENFQHLHLSSSTQRFPRFSIFLGICYPNFESYKREGFNIKMPYFFRQAFVYNCIFFFVFGFLFVSEKFSSALPWARYSVTPSAPSHFLLKKRRQIILRWTNNFELFPQRFSLLYPVPVYLCLTGWRGVILSEIQISIQIPSCAVGYWLHAGIISYC